MSPGLRSKPKDKKMVAKDNSKASSKPAGPTITASGVPASGYNPLSGTFHTFETAPMPSVSQVHGNGRFQNIDDADDPNGNTPSAGVECDSVSNNDSWSGESEDHKEKAPQPQPRPELVVPGADNDKREKIRLKNERKHQRQKERRAQELHERCSGYLMSRKLEALAQQLVAMGFSQERATMALILNEGRVEESVAWLFEVSEEDKQAEQNIDSSGNLKIDISEELARITEMEFTYKASKQEVERAIVSCEGDLDKAEEMVKSQKEEPPKPEETGDPPSVVNPKPPMVIQNQVRVQPKSNPSTVMQQKTDEKDFNYTRGPANVGPTMNHRTKPVQGLNKVAPKIDWVKPQQIMLAEKRWAAGPNPSPPFPSGPPVQPSFPPAKTEAHNVAVGNELKNLKLGSMKEPVTVMQRPQAVSVKQASPGTNLSTSPPRMTMGWYPNSVEIVKPPATASPAAISRSLSPNSVCSNLVYKENYYQLQQQFMPSNTSAADAFSATARGNGMRGRVGPSPALAPPASLGLYSGIGANNPSGSSSLADWTMDKTTPQFDYTSIDWSVGTRTLFPRAKDMSNGFRGGSNYSRLNSATGPFAFGLGMKTNVRPAAVLSSNATSGTAAIPIPGLQDSGNGGSGGSGDPTTTAADGGSRDWTSPFEENDLFTIPRLFVSSPSL
ncbi:uncharacterized protein LOC127244081 [Andrographis paniculata]|uniref:uncharacterized protein LOC127244081 n=1 Tax=Andrographis paniculata TaxID=175694 RepID=UPI0021E962E9|nr:uncharacterized protein LOC127244081 [Andrographis paniculata]